MLEEQKFIEWDRKTNLQEDLEKIQTDLISLKEIEKEFSSMLIQETDSLNKAEELQEKSFQETLEAGKILKEAATIQAEGWKARIGAKFTAIGAGIGLIAGPIGSAIGGMIGGITGASIGNKIEKIQKADLDKIEF